MITALIAYRILSIQRAIRGLAQVNTARSALMMILESAAVYSASVVSLMITYTLNSNAQYTVLDLVSSESLFGWYSNITDPDPDCPINRHHFHSHHPSRQSRHQLTRPDCFLANRL